MFDLSGRRLRALALAAAIGSSASSCGAPAAKRPVAPSPPPSVTGDPLLTDGLRHAGLDIDLGTGWGAYDMPDGNGRDFGAAMLLGREKQRDVMWIEFDPANRRSLSRYVHDHQRQLGYGPGTGGPSRICHGTQAAWYLELTAEPEKGHRDRIFARILMLTINRSRGLVVWYGFSLRAGADPRIRSAMTNMCLRENARGF